MIIEFTGLDAESRFNVSRASESFLFTWKTQLPKIFSEKQKQSSWNINLLESSKI